MDGNTPAASGKTLSDTDRARLAAATLINQRRIGLPVSRRRYLLALATAILPSTAERMRRLAGGRR